VADAHVGMRSGPCLNRARAGGRKGSLAQLADRRLAALTCAAPAPRPRWQHRRATG
jgi:hypothetical protein